MILLVGAALAVLSIAVVVYPFLKSRSGRPADAGDGTAGARSRLVGMSLPGGVDPESVYEAIRTLQLEYQLGQVPEAVYQEQLTAYRLQAAAALRKQAQAGPREMGDAEKALEEEILIARAALRGDNGRSGSEGPGASER